MSPAPEAAGGGADEAGLFAVDPKWFQVAFYGFLLAWLVYLLFETLSYTKFEDLFFPYVIGIPIGLLILIQLFTIRFPAVVDRLTPAAPEAATASESELQRRFEEAQETRSRRSKAEKEKVELVMIAWVTILPFMMFYVGMGWTLILYVFGFTWYFVRDLKRAGLVTLIVVVFVYVLFINILEMIIWRGVFDLPDPLAFVSSLL